MTEKVFETPLGTIHYWVNDLIKERPTLVLLPGLTADHTLFDMQLDALEGQFNLLTWDAPGHAASRPFTLSFTLKDKAVWLHQILKQEGIERPVLVGQSMGGYVSQAFMQEFPGKAKGFVSIDSAPLQRKYYTAIELWLLKRTEPMYRAYPWKTLVWQGTKGCAETERSRKMMRNMMLVYNDDPRYYCRLVGHGYRMLAEAVELRLSYAIDCPALLICGEQDRAGSAKSYNLRWAKGSGLRLERIAHAGHNSNTDQPEKVNNLITEFARSL